MSCGYCIMNTRVLWLPHYEYTCPVVIALWTHVSCGYHIMNTRVNTTSAINLSFWEISVRSHAPFFLKTRAEINSLRGAPTLNSIVLHNFKQEGSWLTLEIRSAFRKRCPPLTASVFKFTGFESNKLPQIKVKVKNKIRKKGGQFFYRIHHVSNIPYCFYGPTWSHNKRIPA